MKKIRILAIDIGNTNIVCGIFEGKKLRGVWRLATKACGSSGRCVAWLAPLLKDKRDIQGIILCSVVPRCTPLFKKAARALRLPIYVVGETIPCPIRNRYRNPRQVGQDRLVNAYAALLLYGAPAIVVDFGTAITVDLISKKGEYMGGIIAPGMAISLEALAERTALLPKVRLRPPRLLLGKDTQGSMLSGVFYGFSSLCDGLVANLRRKYGARIKAILTGGHTPIISTYCKTINYTNKYLTLEGLRLIFEDLRLD